MIVPGVFAFPKHQNCIDWIRAFQPSMVKGFASVTSPDWWRAVGDAAPNAIEVLVHGEISDNPSLATPEADAEATAQLLDSRPGYPRLVISKNELLHATHPLEHWNLWADYMARWVTRAHQVGFDCVVGQLNCGHPSTYLIDGADQWSRLATVDAAMDGGDYWGLHEYWGTAGPLAWWPWTCGRHMMMPFERNILLDEVGFDRYVDGPVSDPHQRGWAANMSGDAYVSQLVTYHQMISDPRVKGTALFLLDFDNNEWQSFDTWNIRDQLLARRHDFTVQHERAVMPARLQFPLVTYVTEGGQPRITQTFAQHPSPAKGLDISCYTGSPVLAVAPGTVDKVIDLGTSSYGKYIQINHGWGFTLYAHLSRFDVTKGQAVIAGQVIGASGNTGTSTGPHLHFEVKSLANRVYPHRVDPAPLLGIGGVVAPSPEPPTLPTPEPSAFTEAELQRCREAKGVVPATIKAAVENGYVWLKEVYTPGDPYAFAVVWDNAAGEYAALKLETRTWTLVAEKAL